LACAASTEAEKALLPGPKSASKSDLTNADSSRSFQTEILATELF
jgi:hypothetical protein